MPHIDRDGVAIHYEVHGDATDQPPLLLTHGYSASLAMWAPNLARPERRSSGHHLGCAGARSE